MVRMIESSSTDMENVHLLKAAVLDGSMDTPVENMGLILVSDLGFVKTTTTTSYQNTKRKRDENEDDQENEKKKHKISDIAENNRQDELIIVMDECKLHLLPPEILYIIVTNLGYSELKALRLVNTLLGQIATNKLIKLGTTIKVSFEYDWGLRRFAQKKANWISTTSSSGNVFQDFNNNRRKTLTDLTDCLRGSKSNLPFTDFAFYGGDLAAKEPQSFFALHGHNIKKLFVSWNSGYTKKGTFFNILGRLAPNIAHLELSNICRIPRDTIPPEAFTTILPKLTSIKSTSEYSFVGENPKFVTELMIAATNLEEYNTFFGAEDLEHVDIFIENNKISTVKKFVCIESLLDGNGLRCLENFSNAIPKLTEILFRLDGVRKRRDLKLNKQVSAAISKILEASKDTMRKIILCHPIGFLCDDLKWPVMKGVTSLSVHIHHVLANERPEPEFALLPVKFSWPRIFPNLQSVDCLGMTNSSDRSLFENYFPFNENLLTVKRLDLWNHIPRLWLDNLFEILPTVEHLTMYSVENLSMMRQFVGEFSKLKSLSMHINVDCKNPQNYFPALDSLLTGLSPDACETIIGSKVAESLDLDVVTFEVNPFLVNLKELKNLTIAFEDVDHHVKTSYELLNGSLSGRYAFKLLPQVEVKICAKVKSQNVQKMEDSLESIAPYTKKIKVTRTF